MRLSTRMLMLFLVLGAVPIVARAGEVAVPGKFDRARMVTTFGERIEASSVRVTADSMFCHTESKGGKDIALRLSDVRYMEISAGSKAGQYALVGALSCGLGAALGAAQANSQAASEGLDTEDAGGLEAGLIVGFTAVGGLVGLLIGSGTHSYKPIRRNGEWLDSVKHLSLVQTRNGVQLALNLTR
jgi:hypothetical protein